MTWPAFVWINQLWQLASRYYSLPSHCCTYINQYLSWADTCSHRHSGNKANDRSRGFTVVKRSVILRFKMCRVYYYWIFLLWLNLHKLVWIKPGQVLFGERMVGINNCSINEWPAIVIEMLKRLIGIKCIHCRHVCLFCRQLRLQLNSSNNGNCYNTV